MSPTKHGTDRRGVLRGAAGLAGAGVAGAWGGPSAYAAAPPRVRRVVARRSGPFEVLALLDAHGAFPLTAHETFPAAGEDDWARARLLDPAAFGTEDSWELDFRCYAVRRPGGRVTLVDTGVGPAGSPAAAWAPVPGQLPQVLRCAGIGRGDVDSVVLTHLHEDHYGWVVSPDGDPMFPGARHIVQAAELAALGPADSARSYVVEPLRRAGLLHEIDGRTRLLRGRHGRGGTVTAVPTPGHTRGHQSVLVDGGHRRVLVTGDVLVHAVQLVAPAVAYRLEADQAAARRTRESVLAAARRDRTLLATSHLNRPFLRVT